MDLSFKIADFLDDMDIEYNVYPSDSDSVNIEFEYDGNSYFLDVVGEKISVNGDEPITYKNFISDIF